KNPRRGRIGNTACAERIQEDLILAAQLQVLQAGAAAQGVVGQVEYVIGFMINHTNFEHVQTLVDGVDQANLTRQQMQGTDTAIGHGVDAVGNFVVDVTGREHGLLTASLRAASS